MTMELDPAKQNELEVERINITTCICLSRIHCPHFVDSSRKDRVGMNKMWTLFFFFSYSMPNPDQYITMVPGPL